MILYVFRYLWGIFDMLVSLNTRDWEIFLASDIIVEVEG